MLTVCGWCHKITRGNIIQRILAWLGLYPKVKISHGICTWCADKSELEIYKQMSQEWKAKCLKHLTTLTKISEILAENETERQWIKDIVKIMLDANLMDISETEQYKL